MSLLSVNTELRLCETPSSALRICYSVPAGALTPRRGLRTGSPLQTFPMPTLHMTGLHTPAFHDQHSRREWRSGARLSGRACIKCEFTLSPLQPNLISSLPNPAAKIRAPPHSTITPPPPPTLPFCTRGSLQSALRPWSNGRWEVRTRLLMNPFNYRSSVICGELGQSDSLF